MFRGSHVVNLDTKGRFAIPTDHRPDIQSTCQGCLVSTIDTETKCLLLYPFTEWQVIEEKIQALPNRNPAARRIQRLLIGHAEVINMDAQGRILLSPVLREYAGLKKRVRLVGQGKKFEVWDQEKWLEACQEWLLEEAKGDEELSDELQSLSL